MKKLGELKHTTKTGLIVVKAFVKDPRSIVGAIAYDKDMRRIGKIVDVIGNVESPYVIIKPETKDILDLLEPGPVYYYVERKKRSKVRGRGRKRGGGKRGRRG